MDDLVSVLSLSAIGRVSERRIRQAGQPVPLADITRWLTDTVGVDIERATAGLKLARITGRLELTKDAEGSTCLRIAERKDKS